MLTLNLVLFGPIWFEDLSIGGVDYIYFGQAPKFTSRISVLIDFIFLT